MFNTKEKSNNTGKMSKKKKIKVYSKKSKESQPERAFIQELQLKYQNIAPDTITNFTDFPLSSKTLKGLKESEYIKPTDIQRETILLGLQGKDILGAAQTGSGKTLAFLIPLLETLFCNQWTHLDGLGALVITPTRELAYQIFECLRKIGKYHDFSAGLVIGGKDLKFERKRIDQCNIVICTPGRLLQHMDENPLFDSVNMKILILDEADRCLDMGFEATMTAIIANLPSKRQTLLFSATQTKSVKDLIRLSLKDPCYISVHENAKYTTPLGLEQSYVICELQNKIPIIWSFIRNHLKKKCIIFFSSCKQVKYIYELFCKLRPGMSILALYGSLHQLRRMSIYESFCQKTSAVLFATDLVARGLDFPEVHWVIHADCPEDVETYIHRVGRTARYHRGGESLLLLLSSEVALADRLIKRKIPINKIDINPIKLQNPIRKMEAFLAKDPTLKESAQRAFVSYAKSVYLMRDKSIFDVHALDTDSFAKSLGLAIPPRIRFLQRLNAKHTQNLQQSLTKINIPVDDKIEVKLKLIDSGVSEDEESPPKNSTQFHASDESDSDTDILTIKRKDHDIELPSINELEEIEFNKKLKKKTLTKAALAKKLLRKKIAPNRKTIFDDEGNIIASGTKDKQSKLAQEYENENEGGINIEKAKMVLKAEDKFDKQLFKEKVKIKHKEEKLKLKQQKKLKEEEDKDDFGTDSEGDEPDLSWLPDPDQIYGNKKEDENSSECEDGQDKSNENLGLNKSRIDISKSKRKQGMKDEINIDRITKKKKRKIMETDSLSVNEAEELAMMFLKNKT